MEKKMPIEAHGRMYLLDTDLNAILRDAGGGFQDINARVCRYITETLTSGGALGQAVLVAEPGPDLQSFDGARFMLSSGACLAIASRSDVPTRKKAMRKLSELFDSSDVLSYPKLLDFLHDKESEGRVCVYQFWREAMKQQGPPPRVFSRVVNRVITSLPGWSARSVSTRFPAPYGIQRGFKYEALRAPQAPTQEEDDLW